MTWIVLWVIGFAALIIGALWMEDRKNRTPDRLRRSNPLNRQRLRKRPEIQKRQPFKPPYPLED